MNAKTWDRATLKMRAQEAFKRNYWMCVLVALILALITSGSGNSGRDNDKKDKNNKTVVFQMPSAENAGDMAKDKVGSLLGNKYYSAGKLALGFTAGMIAIVVIAVVAVILLFALLINALVLNPLEVGCRKFFVKNALEGEAGIGCVGDGFRGGTYGNVVVTMFMRDLKIFLWTLLLVIPGIIKAYEYRMVPYILAEQPELRYSDALEMSRTMMDGQKMDAFILDLSFIGWFFLTAITCGIAGVFWTNPYYYATDAELYLVLSTDDYASGTTARENAIEMNGNGIL